MTATPAMTELRRLSDMSSNHPIALLLSVEHSPEAANEFAGDPAGYCGPAEVPSPRGRHDYGRYDSEHKGETQQYKPDILHDYCPPPPPPPIPSPPGGVVPASDRAP